MVTRLNTEIAGPSNGLERNGESAGTNCVAFSDQGATDSDNRRRRKSIYDSMSLFGEVSATFSTFQFKMLSKPKSFKKQGGCGVRGYGDCQRHDAR